MSRERQRLKEVERELITLGENMLNAVSSPTLLGLLANRGAEKASLEATIAAAVPVSPVSPENIVPHPTLMAMFHERIDALHIALDDTEIRAEACEIVRKLIESITIHPDGEQGPEA